MYPLQIIRLLPKKSVYISFSSYVAFKPWQVVENDLYAFVKMCNTGLLSVSKPPPKKLDTKSVNILDLYESLAYLIFGEFFIVPIVAGAVPFIRE